MTLPGALLPWIEQRFLLANGSPNAGGFVETYIAGTDTPKVTYTDSELTTPNPVVIELDADGRPPDPIYVGPGGYKFIVKDADDVVLYTFDNVQDVGLTFLARLGILYSEGAKDAVAGYIVLAADNLVTVDSDGTGGVCPIYLPAAPDREFEITIKNVGNEEVQVTPDGSDTIDGLGAAFTLPAAVSPLFPAITLVSDGVSAWWIKSSHAMHLA